MQHSPAILRKVFYILYVTHVCHLHIICLWTVIVMLGSYYLYYELSYCPYTFASFSPYDSGGSPYLEKQAAKSVGLVTARLPDAQARSRQRGAVSKAHPTVKVCLHANTSIGTSTRHVWAQTTQAQAQTRVPFPCDCACCRPGSHVADACACACVVPVNQPFTGFQCNLWPHRGHATSFHICLLRHVFQWNPKNPKLFHAIAVYILSKEVRYISLFSLNEDQFEIILMLLRECCRYAMMRCSVGKKTQTSGQAFNQ